jgi:hypothetical protein
MSRRVMKKTSCKVTLNATDKIMVLGVGALPGNINLGIIRWMSDVRHTK